MNKTQIVPNKDCYEEDEVTIPSLRVPNVEIKHFDFWAPVRVLSYFMAMSATIVIVGGMFGSLMTVCLSGIPMYVGSIICMFRK